MELSINGKQSFFNSLLVSSNEFVILVFSLFYFNWDIDRTIMSVSINQHQQRQHETTREESKSHIWESKAAHLLKYSAVAALINSPNKLWDGYNTNKAMVLSLSPSFSRRHRKLKPAKIKLISFHCFKNGKLASKLALVVQIRYLQLVIRNHK